jgi:transposase
VSGSGWWAHTRTLLNQLRAILFERGHVIAQGRRKLELAVDELLAEAATGLSDRMHDLLAEMRAEWRELDRRLDALNAEFTARARTDEAARRLATIPGIGVLNATALVAAVGEGGAFRRGRDPGAWLGLVPKQHTTGGRPKLPGITKRGNKHLRTLFIHGARAALPSLALRRLAPGCAGCSRGPTGTSPSWRSRASSRASPGRGSRGQRSFDLRHGAVA